jgi:hypothetical protein
MYCDAALFLNKGICPAQAARTYTNHPILLKPLVDDTNDVLDTEDLFSIGFPDHHISYRSSEFDMFGADCCKPPFRCGGEEEPI